MTKLAHRRMAAVACLAAVILIAAACGDDGDDTSASATSVAVSETTGGGSADQTSSARTSSEQLSDTTSDTVTITGEQGSDVTLTGPIAVRYLAATAAEKRALGRPLDGSRNAGTRDSGVVYQQFSGGAITAKNGNPGTPAFITWGKIRDAWNVPRAADGTPEVTGTNGSAGPLGTATSDEKTEGNLKMSTFEHGKVTFNTKTGEVEVTVNDKVVPSGL